VKSEKFYFIDQLVHLIKCHLLAGRSFSTANEKLDQIILPGELI